MNGAQVLEKNHFLEGQNRVTNPPMQSTLDAQQTRRRARLLLLLMAAAIAAATIAPMAVLAA
jgi:hypothetical protein